MPRPPTAACIGFVLAIAMGRVGYSPFAWRLLGLLLGPIALLLALIEVRNERPWWARLVASGDPGGGPVDALVGIDGSPESAAATTAALELLGSRVGRLTLVAVTDRASVPVLVVGDRAREIGGVQPSPRGQVVMVSRDQPSVPAPVRDVTTGSLRHRRPTGTPVPPDAPWRTASQPAPCSSLLTRACGPPARRVTCRKGPESGLLDDVGLVRRLIARHRRFARVDRGWRSCHSHSTFHSLPVAT
jgi:hypothetical protein